MNADLFDEIAKSVPEEHLAEYWRVMAHFRQLRPDDEILHIFQAMGVLTLILRQLPDALLEERSARQEQLDRFHEEITKIAENTTRHANEVNRHSDTLGKNLEQNATLFCDGANQIEKASKQAIKDIDIETVAKRLTALIEEKALVRFSALASQIDEKCKLMEKVGQNADLAVTTLKAVHFWPALGAVSGGILCLSLCLVAIGLRQIEDANAVVLDERLAQIQSLADTNKQAFAELARNQIKVEVVDVSNNGQKLYGQEALKLTPALDSRTLTPDGQPKSGLIYFSAIPNDQLQQLFQH